MGRRNASNAAQSSDDGNNNEAQEATMSETVAEATEAPVETSTTDAAEATVESTPAEVDLSAFESAVTEAIENRDPSTGDVPVASIEAVNAQYRELDGVKAKAAAKKLVGEGMKSAINAMDLTTARAYMNLQEKLSAQGGGSKSSAAEKVPADPHEALAQQFAVLSLAHSNVVIGEEIDRQKLDELVAKLLEGAAEKVASYITYLTTETPEGEDEPAEPEVDGYIKNAAKLALGRSAKAGAAKKASTGSGSTYNGPRRDVAKHIAEAFDGLASGTFLTIAKIAEHQSAEYTDADGKFDKPSQGAISARLFPSGEGKKCTVEGIVPDTQDGKKGARKA